MKTRNNITRTAARYAISSAIALVSFAPVSAAGNLNSEISAIDNRFEYLNSSIEKSIKYAAPVVDAESEAAAYETSLAFDRLANLAAETESSIHFVAPSVDVIAEAREAEAAAAAERLESFSLAVEKTIRFNPADYNLSSL